MDISTAFPLKMSVGYRVDLVLENQIVVEIKAVQTLSPLHKAQLLSYLKMGNFRLGYLLNINVLLMKHGIKRMLNGF